MCFWIWEAGRTWQIFNSFWITRTNPAWEFWPLPPPSPRIHPDMWIAGFTMCALFLLQNLHRNIALLYICLKGSQRFPPKTDQENVSSWVSWCKVKCILDLVYATEQCPPDKHIRTKRLFLLRPFFPILSFTHSIISAFVCYSMSPMEPRASYCLLASLNYLSRSWAYQAHMACVTLHRQTPRG